MYYVIQRRHNDPRKHFFTYKVPKFITSKANENIIFEYTLEGQVKRKWAPKQDIILITGDELFYKRVLEQLTSIEGEHLKKIEEAEKNLQSKFREMAEGMQKEFDEMDEQRVNDPEFVCLLKSYL